MISKYISIAYLSYSVYIVYLWLMYGYQGRVIYCQHRPCVSSIYSIEIYQGLFVNFCNLHKILITEDYFTTLLIILISSFYNTSVLIFLNLMSELKTVDFVSILFHFHFYFSILNFELELQYDIICDCHNSYTYP